jgi:hypothetical protein
MYEPVDPSRSLGEVNLETAEILASALIVGPNVDSIATLTGHSRADIAKRAKNMRRNKLWDRSDIHADEWFDEKNGLVSFWQHTLVADGLIVVLAPSGLMV